MMDPKPCVPAADRNKQAILEALQPLLTSSDRVFEFGSGTGQHACHVAAALPDIVWQPSDLADKLPGIRQWVDESGCSNILPPIELDLASACIPEFRASVCYSANTLHIVSWTLVQEMFRCSASLLGDDGRLFSYGPFKFDGQHTSDGNQAFDQQLRASDPLSGIRDVVELDELASDHGFSSATVMAMPANNQLLCWTRVCAK